MEPLSGVALGLGVVNTGYQLWNGFNAASQKRRAVNEAVRRTKLMYDRKLSETTALTAASGVDFGSASAQLYLTDMANEFKRSLDWMRSSGQTEADLMQTSSIFGASTSFASSLFQFGVLNNWGKTPSVT
jgi:hypothetical protein